MVANSHPKCKVKLVGKKMQGWGEENSRLTNTKLRDKEIKEEKKKEKNERKEDLIISLYKKTVLITMRLEINILLFNPC